MGGQLVEAFGDLVGVEAAARWSWAVQAAAARARRPSIAVPSPVRVTGPDSLWQRRGPAGCAGRAVVGAGYLREGWSRAFRLSVM